MVQFEEVLSYSVGIFSIGYAIFYLLRYQDILSGLRSAGITLPIDVSNAVFLAYFLLGFLGAGQIWLGLLHRRVGELEFELEELRDHLKP